MSKDSLSKVVLNCACCLLLQLTVGGCDRASDPTSEPPPVAVEPSVAAEPAAKPDANVPVGMGALPKEAIEGVITANKDQVRACYEQALSAKPDLSGRVLVQFVISPEGTVASAAVKESTLAQPTAEGCMVEAVKKWQFPQPMGGGTVEVNYPFVFTAG